MPDVEVYSEGICYMSVCSSLTPEETEAWIRTNRESGTSNGWKLADEPFKNGDRTVATAAIARVDVTSCSPAEEP